MAYIIILNHIEGVELIIKALRSQKDIVSNDLANGIEAHTIYQDNKGTLTKLKDLVMEDEKVPVPKQRGNLRVIK